MVDTISSNTLSASAQKKSSIPSHYIGLALIPNAMPLIGFYFLLSNSDNNLYAPEYAKEYMQRVHKNIN